MKTRTMHNKFVEYCRRLILALVFILFMNTVSGQIQTQSIKPGVVVKIALSDETATPLPVFKFSGLKIIDARADTSCIGFAQGKKPKIYNFKNNFTNELANWYSKYLNILRDTAGTCSLLINIKKLRISGEATQKVKVTGSGDQRYNDNDWEKGVVIKVEYFLQKDSFFIPVYRYDSIIPFKGDIERYGGQFISDALMASLEKICNFKNDQLLTSGKKILFSEIDRVNKQSHDFPIYRDTVLKRGVYKSFQDFKMNIISWPDFDFKKGKMADFVYIKENGNETVLRSAWGFCDGENYFINSGDKYSKLIRSGFSFYFAGTKGVKRETTPMLMYSSILNLTTDRGPKKTVFDLDVNYYQLDMENGKVY